MAGSGRPRPGPNAVADGGKSSSAVTCGPRALQLLMLGLLRLALLEFGPLQGAQAFVTCIPRLPAAASGVRAGRMASLGATTAKRGAAGGASKPRQLQGQEGKGSGSSAAAASTGQPQQKQPPPPPQQPLTPPSYPVPEVLAPAGGREQFLAALNSGADAVFLGLKAFNARARAENFDIDDLRELVPLAHRYGMKV